MSNLDITALLATIDALEGADRRAARARVDAAVSMPAPSARAALGMLALDLASSDLASSGASTVVIDDGAASGARVLAGAAAA